MRLLIPLLATASVVFGQQGIITTIAGAYPLGDGGPAIKGRFDAPGMMAIDKEGNLYVATNRRIRKITPGGTVTTFVGTGVDNYNGEGRLALAANVNTAGDSGLVFDARGNLFFSETFSNRIRVLTPEGVVQTLAGDGRGGFSGDEGPARLASLYNPRGLAVDSSGNLYVADTNNYRVRRIGTDGMVTTVAGNGQYGDSGDGGPAREASFRKLSGIAVDADGNIYVSDQDSYRIRRIDTNGMISTVLGTGMRGGPLAGAKASESPMGVNLTAPVFLPDGRLVFGEGGKVWTIERDGTLKLIAGKGTNSDPYFNGPATEAALHVQNSGLVVDAGGNLYMANQGDTLIRRVDTAGVISTIAGVPTDAGKDGPAAFARLYTMRSVAVDRQGGVYFCEEWAHRIRKVGPDGMLSQTSPAADSGPRAILWTEDGSVYTSHAYNTVFKSTPDGKSLRVAGRSNSAGFEGDGGLGVEASLNFPLGLALDLAGNLYIADTGNHRIRMLSVDGVITTVAGNGMPGFSGDNGPAMDAQLYSPNGVAVDRQGNLYIADTFNHRVRRVGQDGVIRSFAGDGRSWYTGDGGRATETGTFMPQRLAVDDQGNVYFSSDNRVRKVTPTGIIATVAGNGTPGSSGDGGLAVNASLNSPVGLAVDANGTLYIADTNNDRIRRVLGKVPYLAEPGGLVFAYALNARAERKSLRLSSPDVDTRKFVITSSSAWLTVTPESGEVSTPLSLQVTASPAGLAKGVYSAKLTIGNPDTGEKLDVPVTMTISGTLQQLKLSQTGLAFVGIVGGAALPPQTFQALNVGSGAMPFTVAASTVSGSGWLAASATGNAVTVRVNPAGLAAGVYFGLVTVSAPSADNSPQSAVVVLSVLPVDGKPDVVLEPAGLVFTSPPEGAPANQTTTLANTTTRAITYTTTLSFPSQRSWFTAAPASGTVQPGQTASIELRPSVKGIPVGVYEATLSVRIQPDNVTRTVNALLVIATGASTSRSFTALADGPCKATKLLPVFRSPGGGFNLTAGWPAALEMQVVDDCGQAMKSGQVTASFSNGDEAVALTPLGDGKWSGTWVSRNALASGINVTATAATQEPKLEGSARVMGGGVKTNADQPVIASGGVRNGASLRMGAPVATNSMVAILGAKLSREEKSAEGAPLPEELGETKVYVAGRLLPLRKVSEGKVEVHLPLGIAEYTTQQVIVQKGKSYSPPEAVLVVGTEPGIFTVDESGSGQGQVYANTGEGPVKADNARPARAGEDLFIYCTGLGPVDGDGNVTNPISVTIEGKEAYVSVAAQIGEIPGTYLVMVQMPEGLEASASAQVVIRAGEQTSQTVTMAVQ